MTYLISYDITDVKHRVKIAKLLEQYGLRVQKSFFQIDIPPLIAKEIEVKAQLCLDKRFDSFMILPVCKKCLKHSFSDGSGEVLTKKDFEIL